MEKTIEIPEGYEARIEGNKVIFERKSEDERIRKGLLRHFKNKTKPYWNEIAVKDIIAYLERQKEQKPAEWRPFDKEVLTKIKELIDSHFSEHEQREVYKDWLDEHISQPAEWSEVDKIHLMNAICAAEKKWGIDSCTANWLKSLRDNYKKCNSHWRPSEEQMEALLNAEGLVRTNNYPENAEILASLYEDLKKL